MSSPAPLYFTPQATAAEIAADLPVSAGAQVYNTDLSKLQFSNDGATFESMASLADISGIVTQQIYVSQISGSDITGTGSAGNPYATISFALSQISGLATSVTPYTIYATGNFTDTNWSLFPWVSYNFNGGSYSVTNPVGVDVSFSSGGTVTIENIGNADLQGGLNIDFNAISQTGVAVLIFYNITSSTVFSYTINGTSTGGTVLNFDSITGFGSSQDMFIANCFGNLNNSLFNTINYTQNDSSNFHQFNFLNNSVIGASNAYNVGTIAGTCFVNDIGTILSSTSSAFFFSSDTGFPADCQIISVNSYFNGGLTLTNDPGKTITLNVDRLSALPTLIGTPTVSTSNIQMVGANINCDTQQINNVGDPLISTDAATKNYVDGILSGSVTQQIYVSQVAGSDITGTGSFANPYSTISFAISQVFALATSSTPYTIYSFGDFTDTDWSIFPWVNYNFNGGSYTITNLIVLDASFASGGNVIIDNLSTAFLAGMLLDFDGISQTGTATIQMQNIFTLTGDNYNIKGSTVGSTTFLCQGLIGSITATSEIVPTLNIQNCDCYLSSSMFADTQILHSDAANPRVYNIAKNQFFGTGVGLNVHVSTGQAFLFDDNNLYVGSGPNFSTIGTTSLLEIFSDGSSYINGLTVSATDPGSLFLSIDRYLTSVPSISGPVTIVNSEISNGMLSNISPVNFTPVDASVAGALEGIDAQLGLNSFSDIFTPTITNVLGTSGSFTLLYAAYTYGKSAAGNVCVVNVKYQYTPTAVDNFVSITIPIGNNFSGATQANMMGSNCYSVVPVGGDIYDISSINTQAAVQVTNKSDVAALNVVNTVNLSFSYLIQ